MDIHRTKRSSLPRVEEREDDDQYRDREESTDRLNTTQEVQDLLQYVQTFSFHEQPPTEDERLQSDNHEGSSRRTSEIRDEQQTQVRMSVSSHSSETNREEARVALRLLEEAQQERIAARRWSNDLREAVYAWVESQRKLLENPIKELREELKQSNQQRLQTEAKLRTILLDQQDRIDALERTVASQNEQILQMSSSAIVGDRTSPRSVAPPSRSRSSTISTGTQVQTTAPSTTMPSAPSTPPPSKRKSSSSKRQQKQPPPTVSPSSPPTRQPASSSSTPRQPLRSLSPSPSIRQRHVYPNGAVREVFPDREVVRFSNGDQQTTYTSNNTVAYYYSATGVTQVETRDKLRLEFANGQVEEHWKKDGRVVVYFADGTEQSFARDQQEDVSFAVTI